tara:strand:- start:101 stop:376 length:276 start_codon:yes stop_codon:yes gene_type:complete
MSAQSQPNYISVDSVNSELISRSETALLADGFEEAILKVDYSKEKPRIVYHADKCIEILQTRDGMSDEEAEEFFDFNVTGAYVGPQTPLFV